MKEIYLIGFRGTSFQDPHYVQEPTLIRAGHVGIGFEDDPDLILGFHPTAEAIEKVGGEAAAIEWLKENEPLEGRLHADVDIFVRAFELHKGGARTEVWQLTLELPDAEYERIRTQALQWYTERTSFTYAFPSRGQPPLPDRDNCATFPRRLALPLPEPTGQLAKYMLALETERRVTQMGQPHVIPVDEQLLKTMELKLSDLAALWRGNKHTPEAEGIVRQYHAVLHCMIELGFRSPLDVDSELPNRLMPPTYFELFKQP